MSDRPTSQAVTPTDDPMAELCVKCGFTYYNHESNTGVPYPCWTPSGRYSTDKRKNNPFPVPAASPLPEEPQKCPICGTKLIPASQAFREIRERITAEEPPACDRCGTPTRNQPRGTFILCSRCIPRLPITEAWLKKKLAIADDSEVGAGGGDLDAIPAAEEPPELKEAIDAFARRISPDRPERLYEFPLVAEARAALVALFAEKERVLASAGGEIYDLQKSVASLSSQLARQQATYEAWGRAFSDEELSSMQEQNNWNDFEARLFKTCQRLSSQLELARDSAAEYEAERNEAGARARAAESSLERLKAEQLTAEEAKALLDGMLEEDLADQAAYEAHTRGFKKLRQISYGSDTGAHP